MINKRFSILHALCLVFICSVVFAVINWLGPLTDRAQELNRVHQWAQQIERAEDEDRFHSIAVSFDGKQFGISTHVKSQSFGGWTYDNGRRAKRYFVYPPGKEVDSIGRRKGGRTLYCPIGGGNPFKSPDTFSLPKARVTV